MTADVLLDDIVERSSQCYLVTEVLNMSEVSMGGSHTLLSCSRASGCYTVSDALDVVALIILSCRQASRCCTV
jgi:hypothetical protein